MVVKSVEKSDFSTQSEVLKLQNEAIKFLEACRKAQIKRIKNGMVGTRNSILYLNLISETKNLLLQTGNLFKSERDFVDFKNHNNS